EICMNGDGDRAQAEENAAWLTAKLLTDLSLPIEQVKQHNIWSGKNCPSVLRGRVGGWDGFLARVAYYMNSLPPSLPSKATAPDPANGSGNQSIDVTLSWSNGGGAT